MLKNKLIPWRRQGALSRVEHTEHSLDWLHREINELFDAFPLGFGRSGWWDRSSSGFEVSETDDEVRIRAELPGMDKKDIHITLDENVLTLRGERHEQHEEKKRSYQVSSMSHGSFYRSIPLPVEVDRDKVKAKFKRGILTLTLPKAEGGGAERRRIPVVCVD